MDDIFIVTETNERVATGHLMECIVCAEELIKSGYAVSLWINDDASDGLKNRIPCQMREYQKSLEEDYFFLLKEALERQPKVIIFNLREIKEILVKKVKESLPAGTRIICIDELGHRELSADIIVNPMIDSYYWDYKGSSAQLFCGAEYLILPKEMETFHSKRKIINTNIRRIIITMGGVDPRNYTSDLIEIVPASFPNAVIDVIIGGGNRYREEIIERTKGNSRMTVSENISNMPELIYEADLIFCAGGNTLHEASCIGTPAMVLPSMPHEVRTAKCFEKKGFGLVIDTEAEWKKEIFGLFDRIASVKTRSDMSVKGKKISDGLGRMRMVEMIRGD